MCTLPRQRARADNNLNFSKSYIQFNKDYQRKEVNGAFPIFQRANFDDTNAALNKVDNPNNFNGCAYLEIICGNQKLAIKTAGCC